MALRIITADERLSAAQNKTSLAIFGPPGVGKTRLLRTLPEDDTVCLDLEAGLKSVQDWKGASIPVRSFADFRDLAVLIGGADPAQSAYYSTSHLEHVRKQCKDSGLEAFLATKSIVFVDSITDLTLGRPVTPAQVVLCMIDLKVARLAHNPEHRDGVVDVIGYAALLPEVLA